MKQLYLTQINILCHSKIFTNQGYMFCYKKGKNIFILTLFLYFIHVLDFFNNNWVDDNSSTIYKFSLSMLKQVIGHVFSLCRRCY